MKKFLSLVCMITCIFGLTACGNEETYTDYEQRKMDTAIQIATQYVDPDGNVATDMPFNPNGSVWAVEGITSPDGRVLGKMGHCERKGENLYKNVPFNKDMQIFESGVKYFK